MTRLRCLTFLSSVLLCLPSGASPADAQRIEKAYQVAMEKWSLDKIQTWKVNMGF
jgi:hypothetical protein